MEKNILKYIKHDLSVGGQTDKVHLIHEWKGRHEYYSMKTKFLCIPVLRGGI